MARRGAHPVGPPINSAWGLLAIDEALKGGKGLGADVMLHAFGIGMGGFGADADRQQEFQDQLVPLPRP